MSNRYVWSKNEINHVQTAQIGSTWNGDTGYASYILSATIIAIEYDNIWDSGTQVYSQGGSYPSPISCSAGKYYSISLLDGYIYCESSGLISIDKDSRWDSADFIPSTGSYKTATRYEYDEKGSAVGTVSNAASSTYPLNNNVNPIAIICTILLLAVRGCYGVK